MEGLTKMAKHANTVSTELAIIPAMATTILPYEPTEEEMILGQEMADSLEKAEFLHANGLAEYTLPATTRVTNENLIVPAGEIGSKERWFIKKNLVSYTVTAAKTVVIVATKRQLKDRGISL